MKDVQRGKWGNIDELVDYFYEALMPELKNERNKQYIADTIKEEVGRGNMPAMDFSEEDLVDLNKRF